MACSVCSGTGWMSYPHPDDKGGFATTATDVCLECIAEDTCPDCGKGMIVWGMVLVCAFCGFVFDETARPEGELS